MFFKEIPSGANAVSDLPSGTYIAVAKYYKSAESGCAICVISYTKSGDNKVSAFDLVITDPDENVYLADIVQRPDRCWRDHTGRVAETFGELIPPFLLSATLIDTKAFGSFEVKP